MYRGYFYDYETGLYYLQSRYYDPEVGRFINVDDTNILRDTTGTINGANLFAYCNNDPVLNSDPSGREVIVISTAALITAIIATFITLVLASYQLTTIVNQLPSNTFGNSNIATRLRRFVSFFSLTKITLKMLISDINGRLSRYKKRFYNQKHHIVPRNVKIKTLKGAKDANYFYKKVGLNINAWYNLVKLIAMFHSALNTNAYYSFIYNTTKNVYGKFEKKSQKVQRAAMILLVVFIRTVLIVLNNRAKIIYRIR